MKEGVACVRVCVIYIITQIIPIREKDERFMLLYFDTVHYYIISSFIKSRFPRRRSHIVEELATLNIHTTKTPYSCCIALLV